MGWAGAFGRLDVAPVLLYLGAICWMIGYDTIYAHQDREDDALVGVKSTARLFAERTREALIALYGLAVVLIGTAVVLAGGHAIALIGVAAFAAHLAWQVVEARHLGFGAVPAAVQVEPRRRADAVLRAQPRRRGAGAGLTLTLSSWR